ncbi:hypothetical protein N7471_006013 [Penicillium samsonianum]|uniref:uncharacterized protein n=1 Tax=Penicillium samsonianum TaxID=1882272 RepID=UPI002547E6C8|nr:uncharacterized protein N7471_006013 [Penicillium samsonianum]KAJ6139527.1 hypothetical protein N7471_006013 [Penicillium samsonianum]
MSSLTSSMATDLDSDQGVEVPWDSFHSENLKFISYNPSSDDHFFNSIQAYSSSIINFCASASRLMDLKFTSSVARHLQRNSHLFVIINEVDEDDMFTSIGTLFLESSHRDMAHHRCSKLGIGTLKEYQHYETEAVNWVLNWAFNNAGLHRVEVSVPFWNTRAYKVYEEIGFHTEGARVDCYFKDGEWWDETNMAILEKDWKLRQVEMMK